MTPALTFFFPYHEVSGVPMLFSRMAVYLAGRGVDVRVIDYIDGAMARRVLGVPGIRFIPFADGVPLEIGDDSVLVMQSILPATIRPELRVAPATRLLFWTLYPGNLIQTIVPLRFVRDLQMRSAWFHNLAAATIMRGFHRQLREFVADLARDRAIIFMDGENYRVTTERLGLQICDPVFVPVPSDPVVINRYGNAARAGGGDLSVAWLGRLADFKIHILIYTLARLSDLARKRRRKIVFHVIGEGPDAHLILRDQLEHPYFRIEMAGRLTDESLDQYLATRVDLLAAMGTSALEGARLGVPTLLLDIAYGPAPNGYVFRWLHETKEYTLGEIIGRSHVVPGNDSLERILDAVERERSVLSEKAFDYYRTHHAIDVVAGQFIDAVSATRFTYGKIAPDLLKKGTIRRGYEWFRNRVRRTGLP